MKRKMETLLSANRRLKVLTAPTLLAMSLSMSAYAVDLPTGEDITHGDADIFRDTDSLTVDQHSSNVVINWDDFSIASGNTVNFLQQKSDMVLNRVVGDNPSNIFGSINAGGQVFLVNQSGILFAPGSSVDAAGLVASTLDMADEDFLSGNYLFEGAGADVINQGELVAAEGGYVAMFGRQAINEGIISARLGSVALASGDRIAMDFTGDGLIRLEVDQAVVDGMVSNHNLIFADGGRVYMTASAAGDLAATVVNNEGIIEASSVEERDGKVFLVASGGSIDSSGRIDVAGEGSVSGGEVTLDADGTTIVSGDIDARSGSEGGEGGSVKVLGDLVGLAAGADIDASGVNGGGEVLVGGDFQGANADVRNASRTFIAGDASIRADALELGDGGRIIVWADDITRYYGHISATGGAAGGNGGFAEVSGKENLAFWGTVDLSAPLGNLGALLLDPNNLTIVDAAPAANDGEITDPADNEILFADGGASDFTISNDLLDATTAAVTLQANNNITVNAAINMAPDLTMEAGNDIIINQSITTGGSLVARADRNIAINANITTTGDLILNSDRDADLDGAIQVNGVALSSNGGDIVLGGGADPLVGYAYGNTSLGGSRGIYIVSGSSLNSAGGDISLRGQSDDTSVGAAAAYGVSVNGAVNSGAGTITINGISNGQAGANSQGVEITAGGSLTSANTTASAIIIDGQVLAGGANSFTSLGVNLNGSVQTTNGGGISITGNAAASTDPTFAHGILVQAGGDIDSGAGDLTFNGTSVSGSGVHLSAGLVSGNGNVSITGATSATGTVATSQAGVKFSGAGTRLSTATGDVVVSGTSNGGSYSQGILVDGATVETTGSGTLTFNGTHNSPSLLSTWGMGLVNAATIQSTAAGGGDITINGDSEDWGLVLQGASQIASNGGAININSQWSSGANVSGVYLDGGSTVNAGANGSIEVALDGNLEFVDALSSFTAAGGTLTIRQFTSGNTIGLVPSLPGAFDVNLPIGQFGTNFTDGFSQISIGDANTGNITVGALGAADINDALLLRTGSNLFFNGIVNIDESITAYTGDSVVINAAMTTTGDLDFNALNGVQVQAAVAANNIDVIADADLSAVDNFGLLVPDGIGTVLFGAGGSLSGVNIEVASGGALALGGITATGTLDITTSGDAITQNGGTGISATGLTTVDVGTGANISLNGTSNDFSSVSVANVGANTVLVSDTNAITVSGDANILDVTGTAITLGGGTYNIINARASTSVEQAAALVAQFTNIYATAADVDTTLNLAGNDFGAVNLFETGVGSTHRNVAFDDDTGNMNILGTTVGATSLTANSVGALDLRGGTFGTLSATGGTITQVSPGAPLVVTGTSSLTSAGIINLTLADNDFGGAVTVTAGGNTAITNSAALSLQGTVTGTLDATATTGGITDS
ncbi:MAG: filamentous hemagglutinin N-terminal domain-containing protein, partial [Alcanivoracaceae bacterium]|nr:filamentous hemagglutinin N-terminal domain-containing protein [Alcanivoracaceae bacterium]